MIAYNYPNTVHERLHGPQGYDDHASYKPWLRDDFTFRCAYCLSRERWFPSGADTFGVDHIRPQAVAPGLALDYENLVYACARCNSYKQDVEILNPCRVALAEHVRVKEDGGIEAITDEGRDYVRILALDDPVLTAFRSHLIATLKSLSLSDAPEAQHLIAAWLSFPLDLPNLSRLRPPRNTRPEGVDQSHYAQRDRAELPIQY